jgi:histidinol-phosphate phosphatase family protein
VTLPAIQAVLFDRDGTIVHDVPYNGNPALVAPVAGAKELLDTLRDRGVKVGVLSNQSGVGRGMITEEQMHAVNARVEALLGPFDGWFICLHAPEDECDCRKPKPKLVFDAAAMWKVSPSKVAVVGDRESDVAAALSAGARPVLVDAEHPLAQALERILSTV